MNPPIATTATALAPPRYARSELDSSTRSATVVSSDALATRNEPACQVYSTLTAQFRVTDMEKGYENKEVNSKKILTIYRPIHPRHDDSGVRHGRRCP